MNLTQDKRSYACPYCGTIEPVNYQLNEDRLEDIVTDAVKDAFEESGITPGNNRRRDPNNSVLPTQMSINSSSVAKLTVTAVVFGVLFCFSMILSIATLSIGDYYLTGIFFAILSVDQLFIMTSKSISLTRLKNSKLNTYTPFAPLLTRVAIILSVVFFVLALTCIGIDEDASYSDRYSGVEAAEQDPDDPDWPTRGLATLLPVPTEGRYRYYSYSDTFNLYIENLTKKQGNAYVDRLIAAGFDVDAEDNDTSYKAYNKDEYTITCYYNEGPAQLSVTLKPPVNYEELVWPTTGLLSILPEPEKKEGIINNSSDTYVSIDLRGYSQSDMKVYFEECLKSGFDESFSGTDYCRAMNSKDNITLYITINKHGILSLSLNKMKEKY